MTAPRTIRRLWGDRRGATIVEFALVMPALIVFIVGLMEGARAIWTFQTLQESAFKAVRCQVIGRTPCDSTANTKQYAVTVAGQSNITVPLSGVTVDSSVTCDGLAGQSRVEISMAYNTVAAGFLPMDITNLTASACMPVQPES